MLARTLGAIGLALCLTTPAVAKEGHRSKPRKSLVVNEVSLENWREVRAPTFTLVSNMDRGEVIELSKQLLRFVEIVRKTSNIPKFEPKVPMRIYVFKRRSEYWPFGGYSTGGFFNQATDESTLMAYRGTGSHQFLFHEYVHYLVNNQGSKYPPWFDEGFAELVSTVQFRDGKGYIGGYPTLRLQTLKSSKKFLKLETILGARSYPKDISEFYAQGWLTTHYLHTAHLLGEQRQLEPMMKYFNLLHKNVPWAKAYRTAFDPSVAEMQERLIAHKKRVLTQGSAIPLIEVEIGEPDTSVLELRKLRTAYTALMFGESSLRLEWLPPEFALEFLGKSRSLGDSPRAKAAMAIAYAQQGRIGAAKRLVNQASSEAPELSQIILARAHVHHLEAHDSEPIDTEALSKSRTAYRLAIEKFPTLPAGHAGLGATFVDADDDSVGEGIEALLHARSIAAISASDLLNLGKLYLANDQPTEARQALMETLRWFKGRPQADEAKKLLRKMRKNAAWELDLDEPVDEVDDDVGSDEPPTEEQPPSEFESTGPGESRDDGAEDAELDEAA